jgi:hypothetical protein
LALAPFGQDILAHTTGDTHEKIEARRPEARVWRRRTWRRPWRLEIEIEVEIKVEVKIEVEV